MDIKSVCLDIRTDLSHEKQGQLGPSSQATSEVSDDDVRTIERPESTPRVAQELLIHFVRAGKVTGSPNGVGLLCQQAGVARAVPDANKTSHWNVMYRYVQACASALPLHSSQISARSLRIGKGLVHCLDGVCPVQERGVSDCPVVRTTCREKDLGW